MARQPPPKGHGPHFLQLVEVDKYHSEKDGTLTRNHQEVDRREMCYFASPFDCPSYVRYTRVLNKTAASPGATGEINNVIAHTMEYDAFTFGVKVYIRIGVDGTLKVFTEDSDGREMVASYKRET